MVDYGRHSETERVLVSNEGLSILNLLKIQSTPFGNIGDSSGDEMNLHMPQDEESEAELKNLAAVPFQIISPANNQSIIGIFQDSLLGSYQFTRVGVKFDSRAAMNLLMALQTVNESMSNNTDGNFSNFQILSQIMPPITLKYKKKQFGEKEDYNTSNNVLEIRDGKYIRGQLDKAVLGSGTNGLIHRTCNDFNNMTSAKFIDDLQNIITEYMKVSSYSVGISDLIANTETNNKIAEVIISKKTEVKGLIDQLHIGVFDNKTGKTTISTKEGGLYSISDNDQINVHPELKPSNNRLSPPSTNTSMNNDALLMKLEKYLSKLDNLDKMQDRPVVVHSTVQLPNGEVLARATNSENRKIHYGVQ